MSRHLKASAEVPNWDFVSQSQVPAEQIEMVQYVLKGDMHYGVICAKGWYVLPDDMCYGWYALRGDMGYQVIWAMRWYAIWGDMCNRMICTMGWYALSSVASIGLGHCCIVKVTWHHVLRLLNIERGPIVFWVSEYIYIDPEPQKAMGPLSTLSNLST